MFKNYLKSGFRAFWKNRGYNSLNIFGLAVGIACAGLIFLWAEDEMTFDSGNEKIDRLYAIRVNKRFGDALHTMQSTPRPLAESLKKEVPGIINTARISDTDQQMLFGIEDKSLYATGRYTDPALFSMLTLPFVQGDPGNPFPQLYSLVITETAAKKIFGEEKKLIGKTVKINNEQEYVITGVIKDLPGNSTLQAEWLAPYVIKMDPEDAISWNGYGPFTYVELDENTDPSVINKSLKNFIQKKRPDQDAESFLFPMSRWHLYDEFANGKPTGGGRIKQVKMLSAIAWIILLIACINFMNLATANSQKRAKEVGVRKVLGVGKRQLVIQFIGEALFMTLVAALVAILIIGLSLPAFNTLMQKNLSLNLGDPVHTIALLLISIICGLVAGSYPSIYLSSFNPIFVLKGVKMKSGGAAFIRKGLVVLQFTVSVVFIISTIIVYLQIHHVKNRKLGFNKDNLVEINMQHDVSSIFPSLKQDLLNTGVIENVALSDHATINGGNTDTRFTWQGKDKGQEIYIAHRSVSPEYVSTSGMQIIEGRDFSDNTVLEANNLIITQSMARLMGKETAVGKIIQSSRNNKEGVFTNMTVIGVISDYVYGNVYGQPGPVLFFCRIHKDSDLAYVRMKPGNTENALNKIERVMKKDNPGYPLQYRFVDDQFNKKFLNEVLISKVSSVFAVLAIVISCLGLFGLAAYTAAQRTKEIGIRKVLGASITGLTRLLSKDFLQLVIIACMIAFPVAWWMMSEWLQSYQYRISISWWIFPLTCLVAILIALLTISFHAIKTAMANPVNSLRSE